MALFDKGKNKNYSESGEVKSFDQLDFASTEAYKLLRTNLQFTLPDASKKCHVIGITSSSRGEGKSTTSINLSSALAATEKKVLLIDGDLRLPTISKKLNISVKTGLSDVLLDASELEMAIHAMEECENLHILASGKIPPNPSELLGSSQMKVLLEKLSEQYDYIVIDFPPVNIVSDALIVSPLLDGMIVVVRQNFSTLRDVSRCERQLELSGVKVLGFVVTYATSGRSNYRYKKKNYKHYTYYEKDGYKKTAYK